MAGTILAAGLDERELRLELLFLQREPERLRVMASYAELLSALHRESPRVVILGGNLAAPDFVRRLRVSEGGRRVSLLGVVPVSEPPGSEGLLLEAGVNAALRRPLARYVLESWVAKLLDVAGRVLARVPVHAQVVGSRRHAAGEHFYALTRNLSVHGALLASPIQIDADDLDLELDLPDPEQRIRVLGRIVREAPEVGWPYFGYGIEFLVLPEPAQRAIERMVSGSSEGAAPSLWRPGAIHSTLRREAWIYELTEPLRTDDGFLVEVRRAAREEWRPGRTTPCHVAQGDDALSALATAGAFVRRHG